MSRLLDTQFSHRCYTCQHYVNAGHKTKSIGSCDKHNVSTSPIGTCRQHELMSQERLDAMQEKWPKFGIEEMIDSIPFEIRAYIILQYLTEASHLFNLPAGLLIDAKEALRGPAHFVFLDSQAKQFPMNMPSGNKFQGDQRKWIQLYACNR